jgi:hypothetical protein
MNKGSLMALALGLSLFGCQSSYKFQENEAFQAYQKEVNEWDRPGEGRDLLQGSFPRRDGHRHLRHQRR